MSITLDRPNKEVDRRCCTVRQAVHHDFDRYGDLLLDLFGGAARPLRNDLNVVVGDVRVRFDGKTLERYDAPRKQQDGERHHQQSVIEGEINQAADHTLGKTP
jgi:hypothetical protein